MCRLDALCDRWALGDKSQAKTGFFLLSRDLKYNSAFCAGCTVLLRMLRRGWGQARPPRLGPQVGAGCPTSYWDHRLGHRMVAQTPYLLRLFETPPGMAILL